MLDITFTATPSGSIVEMGGTGTGSWIGINGSTIVARMGGGSGTVASPSTALVSSAVSNVAGKTGRLFVDYSVSTNTVKMWFQENSTGEATLLGSNTSSPITQWCGTNDGFIGNDNQNLAGSYAAGNFNGVISQARLYTPASAPSPFQSSTE